MLFHERGHAIRSDAKTGVRPDDFGLRVEREDIQQCRFVAVRMQPQVVLLREGDDLRKFFRLRLIAVQVKFANAAHLAAHRALGKFALDHGDDFRVFVPRSVVGPITIHANKRHDGQRLWCGFHQQRGAFVGSGRGKNATHIVLAKNLQHGSRWILISCLNVVVHVRVEHAQWFDGESAG